MKIHTNFYKKLLLLFLTVFIFHDIRVEEELPDECVQEECEDVDPFEKTTRGIDNRAIDNKDIANFCAVLAKQTVHQLNGGNSTKTLTSISDDLETLASNLAALAIIVNNLSIVAQLGLINTSAASSALTTPLVVYNANVDTYNNDIAAALVAVVTAVSTPSQTNTAAAQVLLGVAINNFNNIVSNYYGIKSVFSMYSFAEIKSALAQLNAQLGYLYILQGS